MYRSTCLLAVRFTKGSWGVDCLAIYRSIQSCYIVQPNNYRTYTPHSPHENAWSDQCGDVGLGGDAAAALGSEATKWQGQSRHMEDESTHYRDAFDHIGSAFANTGPTYVAGPRRGLGTHSMQKMVCL
ncbi:Hypothetical protein ERS075557_03346 [Mycobacteroides abscessus]|nr:Hypothetical protein ERS075557_03346 [Mycobacteroides abscessus]